MEENLKPTRRWFRFSLRTMLVLVTVVCIYLGWAMNWKHKRHAMLDNFKSLAKRGSYYPPEGIIYGGSAPLPLRLLGEHGVRNIDISAASHDEFGPVARMFPEAILHRTDEANNDYFIVPMGFHGP